MSTQWYTLRRGGSALIASAALLLLLIAWSFTLPANASAPVLYVLLNLIAYVLFLAGIPAIYAMQPGTGRVGQIGFISLALGTATSIITLFLAIFNDSMLPGIVGWFYYITSTIGYLLVGLVTTGRTTNFFRPTQIGQTPPAVRVFPTWVGWTMFAAGAVNIVLGPAYGSLILLFAIAGYGITIVRATQPTTNGQSDEPSVEPLA